MSKDPAFLFYVNDWMGGTATFSRHQKGAYMDLLNAQFNQFPNRLSVEDIENILGPDKNLWETKLKSKYFLDKNGLYYNQKLEQVIMERRSYVNSCRKNGRLGGRPKKEENNPSVNPSGKVNHKLEETISSSSSSSSLSSVSISDNNIVGQDKIKPDITPRNFKLEAKEILEFLNERTGHRFEPVPANLDLIIARLKEGATVSKCRSIIAMKRREWINDVKMKQYLRPETLFNKTKFAQYKGQLLNSGEQI